MNSNIRKGITALLAAVMVVSVLAVMPATAIVPSRTYTLDADFDEGTLVGVEHETVHDQLQLSEEITTYPVMWIANAGEDTLSKWDTDTNMELARYHTWFGDPASHSAWDGASPSRTCVDLEGNCYVANRHFDGKPADVIKILADDWIDRNGNGVMDTSYDANNDGSITPNEMLPMTDTNGNERIDDDEIRDERIAWAVSVGPSGGLGRSLAIDVDGNIWLGLYSTQVYYELSAVDGSIIAGPIDVSPNTPYGALVDSDGILWGASLGSTLLELDTNTNTVVTVHNHGYGSDYGIALGYGAEGDTHVYQASTTGYTYIEYDSGAGTFSIPAGTHYGCLGIATDSSGNILASNSGAGSVTKFAPDGSVIWSAPAQVSSEARGTVVDSNDDVWVIHRGASKLSKFDGSNGAPLGVFNTGLYPYTYSDATGLSLRSAIGVFGTWTVVFDSEAEDTPWGTVSWNSYEPDETSVTVEVRSSNDQTTWSNWETATNGVLLSATPDGRYLEIETTLQILSGDVSPILYDLTVEVGNQPPDVTDAYPSTDCLWPPNHKFVDITIEGVTDPDGDPIAINVMGITSDEPTASIDGAGGDDKAPDASGVGTDTASLRAERSGDENGRVYEITFLARDGIDETEGSVFVKVPHDQSGDCVSIDSGQDYDATEVN
ncbi:MAG: hypothetical protein U9N46_09825 [Euryarchaeota archaeon]|nr:hypothetical protein [Euryarchaeota archaeon]